MSVLICRIYNKQVYTKIIPVALCPVLLHLPRPWWAHQFVLRQTRAQVPAGHAPEVAASPARTQSLAVVCWPAARTAAEASFLGCSHLLPARWHWLGPMVSSHSHPPAPASLCPLLFLLLCLHLPPRCPLPLHSSPGGGRSPSGPRQCWPRLKPRPSPSLAPGGGAVAEGTTRPARCTPARPIGVRWQAAPPWCGVVDGNDRFSWTTLKKLKRTTRRERN